MDEVVKYIEQFAEAIATLFSYIKNLFAGLGINLGGTSTATDGE